MQGLEPWASCSQSRRATSCATPRWMDGPVGGAIQGACADAGLAEIIIMYEAGFCKQRKNLRAVFTGHGWFAIIIHIDNGKGARENENAKKAEPGAADGAV